MTKSNKNFLRAGRVFAVVLCAIMCLAASAQGQAPAPVRWRTLVRMSSPTEGTIIVRCLLTEGTHVYGTKLPQGGPIATEIEFSGCEGIKLIGNAEASPAAQEIDDPLFGMKLAQWTGNFEVKQKFKLAGPADKAKVAVKVRYMSCDNHNCRPPKTENFTTKVPEYKK